MNQTASRTFQGVTLLKIILPVCLIALGVAGFWHYKSKKVKFKRKPAVKTAPVVDVMKVNPDRVTALIRAMGTVRPDREVVIKSRVAGTVIQVAPEFVQGGLIRKGQTMVRVDPADYKLAVNKAQNALARARADFEIEKGQQQIAREELKLMTTMSPDGVKETSLALRKPQLEQARAAVAIAQSDLDAARLDLERTRIIAPFHALVLSKVVDAGAMTAAQGALATPGGRDLLPGESPGAPGPPGQDRCSRNQGQSRANPFPLCGPRMGGTGGANHRGGNRTEPHGGRHYPGGRPPGDRACQGPCRHAAG